MQPINLKSFPQAPRFGGGGTSKRAEVDAGGVEDVDLIRPAALRYARAVWDGELEKLGAIETGVDLGLARNDRLMKIVCRLAGFIPAPWLAWTADDVRAAVEPLAEERQIPGWDRTLESGLEWGAEHPRRVPRHLQRDPAFAKLRQTIRLREGDLLAPPLNDLGNAERFVMAADGEIRHVEGLGWLVWNGRHHDLVTSPDPAALWERFRDMLEVLGERAAELDDADQRDAFEKWAKSSGNKGKIQGGLMAARGLVLVDEAELDRDPDAVCCANGVLDLRTGRLSPHIKEELWTKCAPVSYRPEATCERWIRFLDEIFDGDAELIRFVQRSVGYALTGHTNAQCWWLLSGSGSNGKSTLIETIEAMLGDYAQDCLPSTLAVKRYEGIPNDLARMRGARFVATSEPKKNQPLDSALVKKLTGGNEPITARFLHREFFEFTPELKLWLAANHLPDVDDTSDGFWRRVLLVPFRVQIPPEKRDPELGATLRDEIEGIFAWAVQGALDWYADGQGIEGLRVPDDVLQATEGYREESDPVGRFIEEMVIVEHDAWVSSRDLHKAYQTWAAQEGLEPMTKVVFCREANSRGLAQRRTSKGRGFSAKLGRQS